jgi:hypothetical protein
MYKTAKLMSATLPNLLMHFRIRVIRGYCEEIAQNIAKPIFVKCIT